ncbi:MAG: phosphotransferase [Xanthomonadaceae bacterium]|nr:phosphotransferase [Xanthomonadaceae bacterium]MDE3071821.1 phosphotransferase [Pseudomonadota bacterium]
MKTPDRATARLDWIRSTLGDGALTLAPASADASFRSYWRTRHAGQSWILMDSPPALEDPAPWLAIGSKLAAAGLHVPAVHAVDPERGFVLIEDLGSRLYLPALDDATVDALYGDALDALLRMQTAVDAGDLAPYDAAFLRRELELMPEWFLGRHLGCTLDDDDRAEIEAAFGLILASALEQPRCFVHRDFHSRNLLIVDAPGGGPAASGSPSTAVPMPRERGAARLANPGIIDFQGALRGPIAYDLASLLRDCYIVWPRERVEGWVEDYRRRLRSAGLLDAGVDRARFRRWFDLIGLQRHLKVLGIFCRLWYRDGKHGYLGDLPRVHAYVIDVARGYPELAALAALLERCVGGRDLARPVAA